MLDKAEHHDITTAYVATTYVGTCQRTLARAQTQDNNAGHMCSYCIVYACNDMFTPSCDTCDSGQTTAYAQINGSPTRMGDSHVNARG